jgi:pilus assembly protein CpaB
MKSRNILIAALIMAIITTVLFRQYLKELDKKYKANQHKISIVVAKQGIGKYQKVTPELLELREFSEDSVHPEAIKKVEEIVGNYALTDIKAGEILFTSRFTNQFKEKELITRKIREGYRAISIEANFVESVTNMIEPEDYVDITFSEKIPQPNNTFLIKTETLLDNVRVLAVGKRIIANEAAIKDPKAGEQQQANQVEYSSVTVELKPEEILKIVNADEKGNLKFVLRSKIAP